MNLIHKYDMKKKIYALEPTTVMECGIIKLISEIFPENFEYSIVDNKSNNYGNSDFNIKHEAYPVLIIKDFKEWMSEKVSITLETDGNTFTNYSNIAYGSTNTNTRTISDDSEKEEGTVEE